jgi:hypothetical protein
MTKVAICYWGMTRSTKIIYESHITNLYIVLKKNNIDFNVFMHTWETKNNMNIVWEKNCNVPIDYDEYKLLNPNYYKIEKQNEFLNTINFENYFDQKLYNIHGGDTPNEWRPQLIMNHLCALESQKRVYNMVIESNNTYDFIIYIRPDVKITNSFDINWLKMNFDIIIPSYDHHEGYNDRFAILPFDNALKYSTRIDEIIEFRKNHGRIVSEKYVKYIVSTYYSNVKFIDFMMKIIRPDGSIG